MYGWASLFFGLLSLNPIVSYGGSVHAHGQGVLDVAIGEQKAEIYLKISAHDAIGFEYKAKTKEQIDHVNHQQKKLSDPAQFILVQNRSCQFELVEKKGFKKLLGDGGALGHHSHDHHDSLDDSDHNHGSDDDHHHDDHDALDGLDTKGAFGRQVKAHTSSHTTSHSDIELSYKVTCTKPLAGSKLILGLDKVLPRLKKVTLQVIGTAKPFGGLRKLSGPLEIGL